MRANLHYINSANSTLTTDVTLVRILKTELAFCKDNNQSKYNNGVLCSNQLSFDKLSFPHDRSIRGQLLLA